MLDAPAHGGGDIDWHSFDAAPADAPARGPADAPARAARRREVHALLASPLRYPGMPADRLWEMEDAQVNLGLVEAEPWDLARLLVAEFALTYGNDWLVVPVDVPFGSLTTVESVMYTTTFGERFVVRADREVSPDGALADVHDHDARRRALDGLLVPPGAVAVQDGPASRKCCSCATRWRTWPGRSSERAGPERRRARSRARARRSEAPGCGSGRNRCTELLLQTGIPDARSYLPRSPGYRAIESVWQDPSCGRDRLRRPPLGVLNEADAD